MPPPRAPGARAAPGQPPARTATPTDRRPSVVVPPCHRHRHRHFRALAHARVLSAACPQPLCSSITVTPPSGRAGAGPVWPHGWSAPCLVRCSAWSFIHVVHEPVRVVHCPPAAGPNLCATWRRQPASPVRKQVPSACTPPPSPYPHPNLLPHLCLCHCRPLIPREACVEHLELASFSDLLLSMHGLSLWKFARKHTRSVVEACHCECTLVWRHFQVDDWLVFGVAGLVDDVAMRTSCGCLLYTSPSPRDS